MNAARPDHVEVTVEVVNSNTSKEWTIEGDNLRRKEHTAEAIWYYTRALDNADAVQRVYLIPRIMACYRRQNLPNKAKDFLLEMIYAYGIDVADHVTYTVMASVHSDLNEWSQAQICADRACELNDGVIDEYLNAVYARINYNVNKRVNNLCFA